MEDATEPALAEITGGLPILRGPAAVDHECFAGAVQEAPVLHDALCTFSVLRQAPGLLSLEQLTDACFDVRAWADERGFLQTATYFAEAAALIDSENPARANDAGRFCRRAGLDLQAGAWFYRAYLVGVKVGRPQESTQALLRYGTLMYHLGEYGEARRFLWQSYRRARRNGQRKMAAAAQHELAAVATEANTYAVGEVHVQRALWLYPASSERLPHLVHDFGYLLAENRLYTFALPLLRGVLPLISAASEQGAVWAHIARAAAGAGQTALYREAAEHAEASARRNEEHAAAVLSLLAHAAFIAGEQERAAELARATLPHALRRKEPAPRLRAEAVLEALSRGDPPPRHADPPPNHSIESLSRECLARLREWRPRQSADPRHSMT